MQAIIYRLSFYNTEVLTKGGSGRRPLFLFTRNRKRNTCEKRYSLQTFPPSLPPTQLIPHSHGYLSSWLLRCTTAQHSQRPGFVFNSAALKH